LNNIILAAMQAASLSGEEKERRGYDQNLLNKRPIYPTYKNPKAGLVQSPAAL